MAHALLLVLLSPVAAREPVGSAGWERLPDPLERRVLGLLAGEPLAVGALTVVPLYARVPSEAGAGEDPECRWLRGVTAREVVHGGATYLRVRNPSAYAVVLPAGAVFAHRPRELVVRRPMLLPPDFAALVPAEPVAGAGMFELAPQGLVPPEDVARLLLPPGGDAGPRAFGAPPRPHALLAALAPALDAYAGTAVGAVFLVEDRPVAAHVFGRHDLFVAALPDLVPGVAAAARERPRRTGVDARAVALAWLRAAARNGTGWSESCGEGSETTVIDPRQRTAGHAVTDERGTLVHAAFHVAAAWPGSAPLVRRDPVPPVDPDETSRGASVRPTAAEQRRREREPEPGGKAPDGVRNP